MSVLINTRWKIWTFWETNKKQTTKNFPFHPDGFLTTENSVCVYVTLEEMRPIKSLKNWLYLKAFYHTWCLLFRASSIDPAAAHLQQSGSIFFYPRFFLGLTVHVILPLWNISNHFSFPFFLLFLKEAQRTTLRNGWRPITWQLWNRWWKEPFHHSSSYWPQLMIRGREKEEGLEELNRIF